MTSSTHALKHNGAPYTDDAVLVHPLDPKSTSGLGRALCTCGSLSDPLPTGAARRAWHKEHKAQAELAAATVTVEVPFTGIAKHFWFQLGRPSAKLLADKYPDVEVGHDDKTRVVTVTGVAERAQQAATDLASAWAAAPEVFAAWKRENEAYRALKHTVVEDRRTSYVLTTAFWADYAQQRLA